MINIDYNTIIKRLIKKCKLHKNNINCIIRFNINTNKLIYFKFNNDTTYNKINYDLTKENHKIKIFDNYDINLNINNLNERISVFTENNILDNKQYYIIVYLKKISNFSEIFINSSNYKLV